MDDNGYLPHEAEEFDDMFVEFKNATFCTKSEFEATIASVEFVFPRFKGKLGWSRMCLNGWNVVHIPRHTVPLAESQGFLIAVHFCSLRFPRLAVGMLLQQKLGLRPSEMLALTTESVSMPEHRANVSDEQTCVIALGQKTGTKAKREQSVALRCGRTISWLRWAISLCSRGSRLFPYSYERYRNLFKQVEKTLGVSVGWTPHSPRAGFASEAIARGLPFSEVREAGRWRADSSLRTYIDIVAAAQITVDLRVRGFVQAQLYARSHFESFLPGFPLDHVQHQGFPEGSGRAHVAPMERGGGRSTAGRLPRSEGLENEEDSHGHSSSDESSTNSAVGPARRVRFAHAPDEIRDATSSKATGRGRGRGRS